MAQFRFKKKGGSVCTNSVERFFYVINDNEFIDLPLFGAKFTWSYKQERVALSRIDRFLISKCEECNFL